MVCQVAARKLPAELVKQVHNVCSYDIYPYCQPAGIVIRRDFHQNRHGECRCKDRHILMLGIRRMSKQHCKKQWQIVAGPDEVVCINSIRVWLGRHVIANLIQ